MVGRSRRERAREKPGARERKRPHGKKRARVVERIKEREREIHTVRESRPELARRPLASDPSSLAGHLLRPCRPPRRPLAPSAGPPPPLELPCGPFSPGRHRW